MLLATCLHVSLASVCSSKAAAEVHLATEDKWTLLSDKKEPKCSMLASTFPKRLYVWVCDRVCVCVYGCTCVHFIGSEGQSI